MKATLVGRERGTPLLPDEVRSPGSPCGHCSEFILTPGNGGSLGAYSVFASMDRIWPQFFLWCLAGVHGCCLDVFHLARLPFFYSVMREGRLLLGLLFLSIGFSDLPASFQLQSGIHETKRSTGNSLYYSLGTEVPRQSPFSPLFRVCLCLFAVMFRVFSLYLQGGLGEVHLCLLKRRSQ